MHGHDHDPLPDVPDVALLTVSEVAATLRVSKAAVYRLLRNGELRGLRAGRGFRVPAASLRAFVRRHNRRPGGQERQSPA